MNVHSALPHVIQMLTARMSLRLSPIQPASSVVHANGAIRVMELSTVAVRRLIRATQPAHVPSNKHALTPVRATAPVRDVLVRQTAVLRGL
jgi:hypothetical protein